MLDEKDLPTTPSGGDAPPTMTVATEERRTGPERRIGPYRILRELGHGGMGTVYLAARADEQYEKRVAIKVIRAGMAGAEVVGRFRRERQILASLDHPNIARLLDGGATEDGLPYLVMEYIEGQTLHEYCDGRRLPVTERLKIFREVCSAVSYAHRNLIVHRDLKPNNILVTADGTPRLLDFGIAKLLNPEPAAEAFTATEMALTPEYASPEQARGEPITTASDVYSLGVILYELLTGQRPYRLPSRNPLEVLRAVVEQEPQRPSTAVERLRAKAVLAPEGTGSAPLTAVAVSQTREGTPARLQRKLRGDLDNILMLALRKEPPSRYASVEAFSDDIRRYLQGLPVTARKPTVGYRAGKFVRRHAAGVTAAAAAFVLLVGFAVAMAAQSARVARERDVAQKERATAQHQRETAQRERETAQRVSAFLVDLFKVSDPSEARGNTITAREVLDKGAARIATELKGQPEVQATLMDTMGNVYRSLGLYDKAIPLLEEALQTRRAVLGTEHLEVAKSLNSLAGLLDLKGHSARAEALFREAVAMRRKLLGSEHPDVARSLNNLANTLSNQGEYAEAEELHRQALAMRRKLLGDDHPDVARSLNNLGLLLAQRDDFAGAEPLHREALALKRKQLGNEHPAVATAIDNLGIMVLETGDPAGAEALHREALAMLRKLLGNEHPDVAISLANLGEALYRQQKLAEAEQLARQARAIFKKVLPGHPYLADAESILGGCLARAKRYGEAEPLLVGSYGVLKAKTGERSRETRKALQRVVALYEAWGKPDRAARYRAELAPIGSGPRS